MKSIVEFNQGLKGIDADLSVKTGNLQELASDEGEGEAELDLMTAVEEFVGPAAEGLVVALSRYLEDAGLEVETKEANVLLRKTLAKLLGPSKNELMKRLRIFDRVGGDRLQRKLKREL